MEFRLFIQNFVPNSRREKDPDAEHKAIFEDIEAVIAAPERYRPSNPAPRAWITACPLCAPGRR